MAPLFGQMPREIMSTSKEGHLKEGSLMVKILQRYQYHSNVGKRSNVATNVMTCSQ